MTVPNDFIVGALIFVLFCTMTKCADPSTPNTPSANSPTDDPFIGPSVSDPPNPLNTEPPSGKVLEPPSDQNGTNGTNNETTKTIMREFPRYLEQHVSDLRKERHRSTKFQFVTLKTTVSVSWEVLPARETVTLSQVNGSELCPIYFHIDLTEMGHPNDLGVLDICIFKENGTLAAGNIFSPSAMIEVLGHSYNPSEFLDRQNLVIGFVNGQTSSLVQGYLEGNYFYGIVRLFDKFRRYHIHYYVEPISNAKLYSERFICEEISFNIGENAIMFEFIPHEDYLDDSNGTNSECTKKLKHGPIDKPKSDWNEDIQGGHFMEENIIHDDDDIVHYRTISGSSNSRIFDLRFFDTLNCEICVWIQPNFAEKFGLGLNIERGVAEAISILKFTNQIFRSLDFNEDGVTENIGIIIKKLLVTDEISALDSGSLGISGNISRNISTTTPKLALKHMEASMKGKFQGCCLTIGLIYHNMAPAIMGTSVAGICTKTHNFGVLTGYTHNHKIGYFDVYRGLMHTLGHSLGGTHDVISEAHCYKNQEPRTEFRNEYPLHPVQLINLGMRPKSLTFSPCSKDDITKFLTSKTPTCLQDNVEKSFCGNGVIEAGEECDCGSIRDCRLRHDCCGESDTLMGCKIIVPGKRHCFHRAHG